MIKRLLQWMNNDSFSSVNDEKSQTTSILPIVLQPIEPRKQLALYRADVDRLKTAWSDEKTWDTLFVPALENLSKVVQRLPVTSESVFSEVDGLFLASIKSATYAVEIMEGTVKLERNIMAQELIQSRLKGAALLASLCAFVKVMVNEIEIRPSQLKSHPFFEMDEAHFVANLPFNPLGSTYFDWVTCELQKNPQLDLLLLWKEPRFRPVNAKRINLQLFVARMILPPQTLAWLGEAGHVPLLELMRALTATETADFDPSSVIYARDLGVFRACQLERERMGAKLGRILKPYGWQETLIRLLRARIWQDWSVNAKDSPLRRGGDGLFLFWPDVCDILIRDLADQGLKDLPNDPNLWAGLLLDAGITLPSNRGTATAMIAVTSNAKPREAIKLSDEKFFSVGQVDPKKTKRAFECDGMDLAQIAGISRLTREVIEKSQKSYEDHLPQKVEAPSSIHWRWATNCGLEETNEMVRALASLLTMLGSEVAEYMVEEGVLLPRRLLERSEAIKDPTLLIAKFEKEGFLLLDEEQSILFAKFPSETGDQNSAPILLPNVFKIEHEVGLEKEVITYETLFAMLKHKKCAVCHAQNETPLENDTIEKPSERILDEQGESVSPGVREDEEMESIQLDLFDEVKK